MNYAHFSEWVRDRVEELVRDFGVPREAAEEAMHYMELASIAAEAAARRDDQFLLDLKSVGSAAMAERLHCSPQYIRRRRLKLLQERSIRLRARLRD